MKRNLFKTKLAKMVGQDLVQDMIHEGILRAMEYKGEIKNLRAFESTSACNYAKNYNRKYKRVDYCGYDLDLFESRDDVEKGYMTKDILEKICKVKLTEAEIHGIEFMYLGEKIEDKSSDARYNTYKSNARTGLLKIRKALGIDISKPTT